MMMRSMTSPEPEAERAVGPDAAAIKAALGQHVRVADEQFDRLYPGLQRLRSRVHWTPVDVAMRVAELLASSPGGRVLDIGSGVGKACVIGALTTTAIWHGIERSAAMVRSAQSVARRLGVEERARFMVGDAVMLDLSMFGGFYLYNPFAEALFRGTLDKHARREAFRDEVEAIERKLRATAPGTRVVTYHGFGGDVPDTFELEVRERCGQDEVCLWIRG